MTEALELLIARDTGDVRLPNGIRIGPDLQRAAFQQSETGTAATAEHHGAPPFMHYRLEAGAVRGSPAVATLCFYGELLLHVELHVNLYPPNSTWDDYTLDTEARTKQRHEELLAATLGPPPTAGRRYKDTSAEQILEHPVEYAYPWGRVGSYHDARSGNTFIRISYGNRREEANRDYLKKHRT